jgi:uncharacterized membrane protein YozB (DUF420 family)
MEGFLGTQAPFVSDLSLIHTWVLGVTAVVGAINGRRRHVSKHCPVMATAGLLNWIPVLVVMIPKWLGVAAETAGIQDGLSTIAPLGHGVLGGVTQLLMTYTVTRMYWLEDLPPGRPIWLMRATGIIWALTLTGGAVVYFTLCSRGAAR